MKPNHKVREWLEEITTGATEILRHLRQGDNPELWRLVLGIQSRAARGVSLLKEEEPSTKVVSLGSARLRKTTKR